MLKKKDLILIGVLLCVAVAGLIIVQMLQRQSGALVTVTVSGKTYGTYSLNTPQIIEVEDEMGYNRIVIEDGYVHMEEADCPDQYCVKHAKIHYSHETIICLPHELVVEISGGEDMDVDIMTQ
ncbi:MAG: NusG domain II-containing protein [Coprococcus sp.]